MKLIVLALIASICEGNGLWRRLGFPVAKKAYGFGKDVLETKGGNIAKDILLNKDPFAKQRPKLVGIPANQFPWMKMHHAHSTNGSN